MTQLPVSAEDGNADGQTVQHGPKLKGEVTTPRLGTCGRKGCPIQNPSGCHHDQHTDDDPDCIQPFLPAGVAEHVGKTPFTTGRVDAAQADERFVDAGESSVGFRTVESGVIRRLPTRYRVQRGLQLVETGGTNAVQTFLNLLHRGEIASDDIDLSERVIEALPLCLIVRSEPGETADAGLFYFPVQ